METEVGVEGNDEGKFDEPVLGKSYSAFSSTKQLSDPIVYKLVRVEGDGRLVPATDDEVMEVKGLLIDDKNEMHIVADTGPPIECISNDGSATGMLLHAESSEGLSQSENTDVNPDKLSARLEETAPSSLAASLNESNVYQSRSTGDCSHPPEKQTEGGSLISLKPDFSKLKGEICLENLSIKELHETFKATFGRETTVKDKQWLKRRITMGLTNSCDVSLTTFIIKDNKLVKKDKEEGSYNVDGSVADDQVSEKINSCQEEVPSSHDKQSEDQVFSDKRNHSIGDNSGSEDHNTEQRAAKRVRKPTRRYIEELSEVESKEFGGRSRPLVKGSGIGEIFTSSHLRPVRNVSADGRSIITRLDSLGGSGIQIPCVSRVRRSRPRKNFMALLKFDPSSVGMTATLVKKAIGVENFLPDNDTGNKLMKPQLAPVQVQHQFVGMADKDKQYGAVHDKVIKQVDSCGDSDDNIVTVPTSKGGMRRKHHRAWTLSEVMKLVEGVSRFGAGRWSEIKRLAFASYSYRTSVDLKDKWRNLLKASFAQIPADKGVNSRKNAATMPIPEPILLRVRELAEMQSQGPPNQSSSKVSGNSNINVHEKQSGYL